MHRTTPCCEDECHMLQASCEVWQNGNYECQQMPGPEATYRCIAMPPPLSSPNPNAYVLPMPIFFKARTHVSIASSWAPGYTLAVLPLCCRATAKTYFMPLCCIHHSVRTLSMQDSHYRAGMYAASDKGRTGQMLKTAVHVCKGYGNHPRVSSPRRMLRARC